MNILIKFTDQSQSFTYGVEFGRILEKIERGDDVIMNNGFPIRVENISVIKEACKIHGYTPLFGKKSFNEWISFIGIKKINKN